MEYGRHRVASAVIVAAPPEAEPAALFSAWKLPVADVMPWVPEATRVALYGAPKASQSKMSVSKPLK